MSERQYVLPLLFIAPMQSYGTDSKFNNRHSNLYPSKSAVYGMICAAKGLDGGSAEEASFLSELGTLTMETMELKKEIWLSEVESEKLLKDLNQRRMTDYHTVLGTRNAEGKILSDAQLTYRQYLNDSAFCVLLKGEKALLDDIRKALNDPVWGIWLGRKSCVPACPVAFHEVMESSDLALDKVLEKLNGIRNQSKRYRYVKYSRKTAYREDVSQTKAPIVLQDIPLDFRRDGQPRSYLPRKLVRSFNNESEST